MTKKLLRIGGVLRCHGDWLPQDAEEGDVVPCEYCDDGLILVTRENGQHWEAGFISLGWGWRDDKEAAAQADGDAEAGV